jgi:hypothetical protein
MKNNVLIISCILMLWCITNTNAQPPNYDMRCEQYLVDFCTAILTKAKATNCDQWGWNSFYDVYCTTPGLSQYTTTFPINRTGGVMIGAHSLLGNKLVVTDGIISTGLKVSTATWPDYVFDPSYKLTPLSNVKKFVSTNKHLPNTPSASDIDKNGGFNIGETFVNHQEKIEEIYLHLIALKKEITGLQKEDFDLDIEQIDLLLAFADKIDTLIKK